jgi:ATP-dependent NAD(P)H-hydrate dehydratase
MASSDPLHALTLSIIPAFPSSASSSSSSSSHHHHKGAHGKVAIVGGSLEYTGAPFYAAVSSLKVGADLAWVLCAAQAAVPIKSYSPELIVLPILPDHSSNNTTATSSPSSPSSLVAFGDLAGRLDALVVGPGLGRDAVTLDAVAGILRAAAARGLPLVLDGDGLFLLAQRPTLLEGYARAVLTPNAAEFARLWAAAHNSSAATPPPPIPADDGEAALQLSRRMGGVAVLKKGSRDAIAAAGGAGSAAGRAALSVVEGGGSPRRCGGQGDVLAGSVGTFLAWAKGKGLLGPDGAAASTSAHPASEAEVLVACARGAALLTRGAAARAFAEHRRSLTTPDLIAQLGRAFDEQFPSTLYESRAGDDEEGGEGGRDL